MNANKGRLKAKAKETEAGGSCDRRSPSPTMATTRLLLGLCSFILFLVVVIQLPTTAATDQAAATGIGEVGGNYEAENQNNNLLAATDDDEIRSDRVRRSPTTTTTTPTGSSVIRSSTSGAAVDSSTAYDADFLGTSQGPSGVIHSWLKLW